MDNQAAVYNRVKRQTVSTITPPEPEIPEKDAEVDAVQKDPKRETPKHRFQGNQPICDICGGVGHIARQCPSKRGYKHKRKVSKQFKRLVYAIQDDDCVPMVITIGICGQVLNALIDSGATVNVINIITLRKAIPNIRVGNYINRLIGTDRKPISVVGATHIPISIKNKTPVLHQM